MTIPLTAAPSSPSARPQPTRLQAYRDDGPLANAFGRLAQGRLIPLPGVLLAAVTTAVLLVVAGGDERTLPLLYPPLLALLLVGPSALHPHLGRLDWLVPPLMRGIEYGYLAALGFAQDVPAPVIYVLLAVLAYHHYDTVYRTRQRLWPREWVFAAGLGWEGRMFIAAFAGLFGQLAPAYLVLAGYLGLLFGVESVTAWVKAGRENGAQVDLEEETDDETDQAGQEAG